MIAELLYNHSGGNSKVDLSLFTVRNIANESQTSVSGFCHFCHVKMSLKPTQHAPQFTDIFKGVQDGPNTSERMKRFPAFAPKIISLCDDEMFEAQPPITQHFNPTSLHFLCSVTAFSFNCI